MEIISYNTTLLVVLDIVSSSTLFVVLWPYSIRSITLSENACNKINYKLFLEWIFNFLKEVNKSYMKGMKSFNQLLLEIIAGIKGS